MAAVAFGPLLADDVDAAARVVDSSLPPSPDSPPEPGGARIERMRGRIEHARRSDPGGTWIAREDGRPAGIALALRSDGVWVLSLLAVDRRVQSGGIGRGLLERALRHADGCRAAVDAAVRVEHLALLLTLPDARLYLAGDDDGYAIGRQGRVFGVAARDERTAQALLWRLLTDAFDGPDPGHAIAERITSWQDWAIEVLLRAGLTLRGDGPIFTRGEVGPLRPYLPTGAYL